MSLDDYTRSEEDRLRERLKKYEDAEQKRSLQKSFRMSVRQFSQAKNIGALNEACKIYCEFRKVGRHWTEKDPLDAGFLDSFVLIMSGKLKRETDLHLYSLFEPESGNLASLSERLKESERFFIETVPPFYGFTEIHYFGNGKRNFRAWERNSSFEKIKDSERWFVEIEDLVEKKGDLYKCKFESRKCSFPEMLKLVIGSNSVSSVLEGYEITSVFDCLTGQVYSARSAIRKEDGKNKTHSVQIIYRGYVPQFKNDESFEKGLSLLTRQLKEG